MLPLLFGPNAEQLLKNLFCRSKNLFSFEHTHFVQVDGKNAGMMLSYGYFEKKRGGLNTGWLLLKNMGIRFFTKLPLFLKSERATGKVEHGEYYISNLAVYPDFRNLGLGELLLEKAEVDAKTLGYSRIALDVDVQNITAMRLYKKLGYTKEENTRPLYFDRYYWFEFRRMVKNI